MEDHPWFKDWFNSPYYHLLYANRDDREAAAFIDKLIDHLKPAPGATMLDVACGKGRHSIHLAEKGFDVTGIDLSEASISEALTHQTDNLHFYIHDMRLPFWINYFDYAFNFFTSFGYFKTKRENDNAIRTIAQSINGNGHFVMDYLNTQCTQTNAINNIEKEINGVQYAITKWFDESFFYKKIVVTDKALPKPLQYTEMVAKFSLADFTEMFEKQGLQIKEVYGDYNFSPYDVNSSQRLIMIARKIGHQ
ncbi:MAG TPA: class I SAM-dependent methyltransferase [Ferruginibacter sp.]|jgi:2-polyprenyl-3-methyl-5-hydroxy-6-metoxy-1,4-benzoquinol methylase|nr:class I SAM-dependent methyltransferase [Ferruginibacter sp.]